MSTEGVSIGHVFGDIRNNELDISCSDEGLLKSIKIYLKSFNQLYN